MLFSLAMKVSPLLIFILMSISSLQAFAFYGENGIEDNEDNYRLLCHFTYERLQTSELQQETFVAYGRKEINGEIKFEYEVKSLSAYSFFFKDSTTYPKVKWHHQAKIKVNLSIQPNGDIRYRYRFYNLGINNDLLVVLDETREVFKPGIVYLNEAAFNYLEGNLVEGYINQETWINERGVTLDKCRIDIF